MISPIAHILSTESSGIPTTDLMASVTADCDDRLLALLLTRSSFRSMSHDSVTSESTFYSDMDSSAGPILGWWLKRESPFVAPMPHPRYYCRLLWRVHFPLHYIPELGFCSTIGKIRFATHGSWSGWGPGICMFTGYGSGCLDPVFFSCTLCRCGALVASGRVPHDLKPEYTRPVCTVSSEDGGKTP